MLMNIDRSHDMLMFQRFNVLLTVISGLENTEFNLECVSSCTQYNPEINSLSLLTNIVYCISHLR